ncbi:hypothetical protein [Sphingobacterium sp.]|uniref:hypothetical protein n=2 Tax=unclassified Sphingobacterium TaxID=2609468 RepID=UPI0028A0D65B|nr:hypothetical protein [Sphingobacterium sp.]
MLERIKCIQINASLLACFLIFKLMVKFISNKVVVNTSIAAACFIVLGSTSCSKSPMPVEPPLVDSTDKKIDYSAYDFERMAALSNRWISDTLWNEKKNQIIGFRLKKAADYEFSYDSENYLKEPYFNAFVSLNNFPEFNLTQYQSQSASYIPYVRFNSYNSNPVAYQKITDRQDLDEFIKNKFVDKGPINYYGHQDYIYHFRDFDNLRLIFTGDVDVKSKFAIPDSRYDKMENTGWLYYSYKPTFNMKSHAEEKDFKKLFPAANLTGGNIVRVAEIEYGKSAYMVLDGPEKIKSIISKLSVDPQNLSSDEKNLLNKQQAYFYLIGYKSSDLDLIRSAQSTVEKIDAYLTLAIRSPETKTYEYPHIGVPAVYKLESSNLNDETFKNLQFTKEIKF